ncbi:cellulase family glycosylhydrolase [Patulibacter sp. NPDC049589]|uniref:cellulase family glycosylhydrolase n=1 Tax=Patulibacter sp. NPDC049589 TaxID=3154731 RepID=UPI00341E1E6E
MADHRTTILAAVVGAVVLGLPASPAAAAPEPGVTDGPRPLSAGDALTVAAAPDGSRTLKTADGRTVQLRGANVNALVDYAGAHGTVPVRPEDGPQARALGFDVVRLAVSWSRIEPSPGVFDERYLQQIGDNARVFTAQGIYVLLDMHQDRYAGTLGPSGDESDGAPAWAAKSDGASTGSGSGGHPYYGTAASRTAARNFFANATVAGKPLQEHYADAVARLAGVGRDLGPGLAGVELYNEPIDPDGTDPFASDSFSPTHLWPLYRRLIARLRSADGTGPGGGRYDGPIWFEPTATRTQTDRDTAAARFSDDPGLVYGPHVYTDVFGVDPGPGTAGKIAGSFDAAAAEARTYGAALAPTELPGASGGSIAGGQTLGGFELHRLEILRGLDRLRAGGIVWIWKQAPDDDYGWGVLQADGSERTDSGIARDYGRARVQASGPQVVSQQWSAGVLTVRTSGAGDVDLWDGAAFAGAAPATGTAAGLSVDGAPPATPVLAWRAGAALGSAAHWAGGRQLRVTVPAGDHTIVLRPVPAALATPTFAGATATPPVAAAAKVRSLRLSSARVVPVGVSRRGKKGRGTTATARTTGATRVRIVLERIATGRKASRGRCVATRTVPRKAAQRCVRRTAVSTARRPVAKGRATLRLSGRVSGRALKAGRYRLTATPLAADGTAGRARTKTLTVLGATRR